MTDENPLIPLDDYRGRPPEPVIPIPGAPRSFMAVTECPFRQWPKRYRKSGLGTWQVLCDATRKTDGAPCLRLATRGGLYCVSHTRKIRNHKKYMDARRESARKHAVIKHAPREIKESPEYKQIAQYANMQKFLYLLCEAYLDYQATNDYATFENIKRAILRDAMRLVRKQKARLRQYEIQREFYGLPPGPVLSLRNDGGR